MEQVTVNELHFYRPRPSDLTAFLPYACSQLQAPFRLRILIETIEEYVSKTDDKAKKSKRDKPGAQAHTPPAQYSGEKQESAVVVAQDYDDEGDVVLRAFCDPAGKPVELVFYHCSQVPRLLLKIIGLCIPYNMQLTKITIRWGPLDGFGLYEIAKFLPLSQITDICLDDSPVSHCNYYLLLEQQTHLKILSLARCNLIDEDITLMASKLGHPLPASRTLAVLSLESNNITDVGARALGEALRTNRTLRHLNLAGNAITDLGASYIFRSLTQFPVSHDEITLKRRRMFEFLKMKRETYERCYRELITPVELESGRSRRKTISARSRKASTATLASYKGSAGDTIACKAETMANELLGAYSDPFHAAEMVVEGGETYCAGNFALSYLNLAYNALQCASAARLAAVLAYQARARGPGAGLLRAVLEGSALPPDCGAARAAAHWLARALAAVDAFPVKTTRKSEKPKFKNT
ncbi:uncharacterized protein [Epargyreus clarus]|uniref:uncharacterized protein n=1 Tax=Epargyreus clarus TaxID=520877 RepID=UPI003C304DFC